MDNPVGHEFTKNRIAEALELHETLLQDEELIETIGKVADILCKSSRSGGRVFFAGNGGSAADAQHLAAELVGRFYLERRGISAEALTTNTSALTAIANDYTFDRVFARQLEANGNKGDVFVGLSTSGNSKNLLQAFTECRRKGITSVALTGRTGGQALAEADYCIRIPSDVTPRVQECHILVGHILCEAVEKIAVER